eukprot:2389036-Amphidinium_carterae.1
MDTLENLSISWGCGHCRLARHNPIPCPGHFGSGALWRFGTVWLARVMVCHGLHGKLTHSFQANLVPKYPGTAYRGQLVACTNLMADFGLCASITPCAASNPLGACPKTAHFQARCLGIEGCSLSSSLPFPPTAVACYGVYYLQMASQAAQNGCVAQVLILGAQLIKDIRSLH